MGTILLLWCIYFDICIVKDLVNTIRRGKNLQEYKKLRVGHLFFY
jgi:hypothetical protein